MSWSKEQVTTLIEGYQDHPCLYNVKSSMYKNKHARQSALEEIEVSLKPIRPNVNINEIKAKFNGLKTNFMTEYRKVQKSKHSGMDEEAVYKPSIWYYELFLFLLNHVTSRRSTDSLEHEVVETQAIENEEENTMEAMTEAEVSQVATDCIVNEEGYLLSEESVTSCAGDKPLKSKRQKMTSDNDNLITEATRALNTMVQTVKENTSVNKKGNTTANEALAQFIVSKLN